MAALPVAHQVRGQAEEVLPQLGKGQLPVGKPGGPGARAVDEEDWFPLALPVKGGFQNLRPGAYPNLELELLHNP